METTIENRATVIVELVKFGLKYMAANRLAWEHAAQLPRKQKKAARKSCAKQVERLFISWVRGNDDERAALLILLDDKTWQRK